MSKGFFVASTGQHVGKTTTCLGLLSGLQKRFSRVGFMKPVGQEHVTVPGDIRVDKDVALFKEWFDLEDDYAQMSPAIFHKGFTRDYLDGKGPRDLLEKILEAHRAIAQKSSFMVVEGTGHVGVGSIVELNNAQVAKALNLPLVMIASGGLGSSFDAMMLNKTLCDKEGVPLAGVIVNKVQSDKQEMVKEYLGKALARWRVPILGCIPYDPFLSNPSMKDYVSLFREKFISGESHRLRHFTHKRLVATSVEVYRELIVRSQLIITPASREDIIFATIDAHRAMPADLEGGFILTGSKPPSRKVVEALKQADIPAFYTLRTSLDTMQKIVSYTAKIRKEDTEKVNEAIQLVEGHIDFDALLERTTL